MKYLITLFLGAAFLNSQAQTHKLTKIWETDSLAVPESALPSFKDKVIYTSLINGNSTDVDRKGGIAKVGFDGKIIDSVWVTGMNAPKGLGRAGNKLYVADLTEVLVVDIPSAKVERKIPIAGSIFLNDITVDKKGVVYVSDTRAAKVYRIKDNQPELWLDSVASANGLKAIDNDLYVLSGPTLIKVNQKKERSTIAQGFAKGGDGIEQLKNGDFIVSCWFGLIYYVNKSGAIELLLDTNGKMNTADFGLDADKNILYVPTFNKKSIIAYQLQ